MRPGLSEERKLWKRGYSGIAGIDEAGRGPFAGPVVAAAVVVYPKFQKSIISSFRGIADSKKLTPQKREYFFRSLCLHPGIEWGMGKTKEQEIDQVNIVEATKRAMQKAVRALQRKLRKNKIEVDYLLLDGNFLITSKKEQICVMRGDEKIFSCALASIVAKVQRDRMMRQYHHQYPANGFDRHKGYGTAFHREMIRKYGLCPIHRRSFAVLGDSLRLRRSYA